MKESKIFTEENLTEIVHYVYRVTIDGKYYIGKRTGLLNDLHTGVYKTSSKLIHEKLQNGFHFSKIKILQVFTTAKDALAFESRILTRLNAKTHPKFLNQSNGNKDFCFKQHTEKTKEKISESKIEYYKTEQGIKKKENHSEFMKERYNSDTEQGRFHLEENRRRGVERFNSNTEEGRKRREDASEKTKAQFDKNTELGRKRCENHSEFMKEYFNPETEQGRKNLEENRRRGVERFNSNTEEGRKRREEQSQSGIAQFNPNTEQGRRNLEKQSQISSARFDKNTEEGRKRRENHSEKMKEYYKTEEGKERRERAKVVNQKVAKTRVQNRKNTSILGELMFDEAFIRQNFLITDDKNNLRFLWSVYSKLTGYSYSHICLEKRIGKLRFLSGIKSIALTEEQESVKIEEIKAIIKSRNYEKE